MIKNISLYSIGNILPQAAGFFLLPIYTLYLTPDEYGIFSSMQVLSSILVIFFTFAVERSISRIYWDYKTEHERKDYLGSISIELSIIAIVVLIFIFIFQKFIGLIYKAIPLYKMELLCRPWLGMETRKQPESNLAFGRESRL